MLILSRKLVHALSFSFALVLLSACGAKDEPNGNTNPDPAPDNEKPPVLSLVPKPPLDAAIAKLMARAEQPVEGITLQHVLIAFQGAKAASVSRTKAEARKLVEKVLLEARSGVNFKDLMQMYSTDPGPGEYAMTKAGRKGMVPGFGNVGFRLKVDEIGVAPYDPVDSPFGWHVIKRVK